MLFCQLFCLFVLQNDGKETAKAQKKDDKAAKKGATIADTKPGKGTTGANKQSTEKLAKTVNNAKSSGTHGGSRSAAQSDNDVSQFILGIFFRF